MSGWIKLHRSLLDWEWYDDHNATRLLIHLLVSVNFEDKKWRGRMIKSGSMVFSWETLSKSVGISVQQARTAMDKLEESKEITREITSQYQVVTLVKWKKMQDLTEKVTRKSTGKQQASNKRITGEQQTDNRPITTTKEYKEGKEDKNERREEEQTKGPDVFKNFSDESQQVFDALLEKFGITEYGNLPVFKKIHSFVSVLQSKKQTEHFIQQAKAYWLYKEKSGDKTHSPQKFIGTIENQYQDGGWCAENWVHKLNNFKENATGKQTTIEKRDQSKRDTADAVMRHYAERLASEEGRGGI